MNRVSSAVTAGLVMSAAGLLIALAATFRLVQTGLFSGDYVAPGQLDFEAVAFAVLGIGLFVSGLSLALVALADRLLGALPADEAVSSSQSVEEALQAPADQGTVVPRSTPRPAPPPLPTPPGTSRPATPPSRTSPGATCPRGAHPPMRAPVADAPVGPSTADRLRARGATMAAGAGPIARSGWDRVRSGSRAAGAATAATARATGTAFAAPPRPPPPVPEERPSPRRRPRGRPPARPRTRRGPDECSGEVDRRPRLADGAASRHSAPRHTAFRDAASRDAGLRDAADRRDADRLRHPAALTAQATGRPRRRLVVVT